MTARAMETASSPGARRRERVPRARQGDGGGPPCSVFRQEARALHGRPAGSMRAVAAGFTLVEMVLVLVLLGILFSFFAPKLTGLTPKYRLRTYARKIAGTIEKARVSAIVRGKTTGIRYVLDDAGGSQYFQILGPAPIEYPEQPLEERESAVRYVPPAGVRIRSVTLPGTGRITSGVVTVGFSPAGTTGSHIVVLEAQGEETTHVIALKYNSISGILDYYNEEVDFQHYES